MLMKEQLRRSRGTFVDSTGAVVSSHLSVSAVSPVRASRASLLPPSRFEDDLDAAKSLEAEDVISENLVTFHDIVELQTRNAQLLRVVRQLSAQYADALESRQSQAESAASAGLQVHASCSVHQFSAHITCRNADIGLRRLFCYLE